VTLVISASHENCIVLASDRRLTANGRLIDDESNKIGHLICDDGHYLYAFTGLAELGNTGIAGLGGFNTSTWLLEALGDGDLPFAGINELAKRLRTRATAKFQHLMRLGLRKEHAILSVMFSGYHNDGIVVNVILTNFQKLDERVDLPEALDEFRLYVRDSRPNLAGEIGAIGCYTMISKDDVSKLFAMVDAKSSHTALIGKTVDVIRTVADNPMSRGLVGRQITTAVITPKGREGVIAGYHTDVPRESYPMIDTVIVKGNSGNLMVRDMKLSVTGGHAAMPKKVGRNVRCPCGSGLKYKRCC
jgi:hypothetical protein